MTARVDFLIHSILIFKLVRHRGRLRRPCSKLTDTDEYRL